MNKLDECILAEYSKESDEEENKNEQRSIEIDSEKINQKLSWKTTVRGVKQMKGRKYQLKPKEKRCHITVRFAIVLG